VATADLAPAAQPTTAQSPAAQPRPLIIRSRMIASWVIFPVVLTACYATAIWAFGHGYNPSMTVAMISLACAVVLAVLERLVPHAKFWREHQNDIPTDVLHMTCSTLLVPPLFEALFRSVLMLGATWLVGAVGWSLWPHSWPIVLQLLLALVIGEALVYWWHRACHENESLWKFHATHHSSERLYWLNSCRFHPIDSMAQYALEITPLLLLGANVEVIALFTLSTAVIGMFQHANIELRLGPLNWFFSMTELHRWHHSRSIAEGNSNYGANLIVWDIVFGTRFLPSDRQIDADAVGLNNMPNFPRRYVGQLLSPFRWKQLRDEAAQCASESSE